MSEFNKVLKSLRIDDGLTQRELGKELGLSGSAISMYERGEREPELEVLEVIADFFNVSIDFLHTGNLSSQHILPDNILPLPKFKEVPLLGTIACGEPILASENIEMYVKVDSSIDADFALKCKGDSMINARIFDGDLVYIRQQPDVENGEIAAVLIGDEATLKKVHKYPNKLVLSACNPMYNDFIYTDEQLTEIRILGKAVAFFSLVR